MTAAAVGILRGWMGRLISCQMPTVTVLLAAGLPISSALSIEVAGEVIVINPGRPYRLRRPEPVRVGVAAPGDRRTIPVSFKEVRVSPVNARVKADMSGDVVELQAQQDALGTSATITLSINMHEHIYTKVGRRYEWRRDPIRDSVQEQSHRVIVTVKNLPTIVIQPGESIGLGLPGEARMASFKRSTPSADCIVKDGKRLDVTGKKTGAFSFRVPYSIGTKQLETTLRGKVVSEVTSLPLALEVATTKELAPLAVNSQLKCVAGEFLEVKNVQNAGIASVTLKEKAVTVSGLAAGTTKAWLVYKGVPAKEREKPEELLTIVTLDITVE